MEQMKEEYMKPYYIDWDELHKVYQSYKPCEEPKPPSVMYNSGIRYFEDEIGYYVNIGSLEVTID